MKRFRWRIEYTVRVLLAVIVGAACAMVAHGEVLPSTATLTMQQAISRAVQTQLTTQLARANTEEARGQAIQQAASLLPQINGSVSQTRTFKINLAAEGFPAGPLLPNPVIGPYNTFDARVQLVQKIFDLNAIWNAKAATALSNAAHLEEDLAAEQVASAAALAYIEDLRAMQAVQDAQANLDLAQRLADLAHNQQKVGLATGVDVARADSSVAQNRQQLIQVQLAALQADLRLKRVTGLPLSQAVALTEPPTSQTLTPPASEVQNDLIQAQSDRVELRILNEQLRAEGYNLDAAKANHLPTVVASGDYGFSGNLPDGSARTGSIGGRLDLPIFTGGSVHGQVREANGRLAAVRSQYNDTQLQIEEDVRLALHTLAAEVDGVNTAETQVALAERELKMAEDRYRTGIGDNIQVTTAQATLADALASRVNARARYADARANLAMALGHMRSFTL